jgi:tetratricopeptide (TPR) repeat protein
MKIFLSYGHDENSEIVLRIKADLERRGHEPWMDVSRIRAGDDWRATITGGLLDSDTVLAFLSRHSVRDPGVCRDELAIALGMKSGALHTVLLEELAAVSPPVTVSHIQWLDMSAWRLHQGQGEARFEPWYQEKFAELLAVVEKHQNFHGEIEALNAQLCPIANTARIGSLLRRGFVGREWLLGEIEQWRTGQRERRVLCITGEPGIGKSTIAAWLAHSRPAQVIGVHFCRPDPPESSEPGRVICSLAFQIATRLPDYRAFLLKVLAQLEKQYTPKSVRSAPAVELFATFLTGLAHQCIDGSRERYLVVIDALDEARPELTQFLVQHHEELPAWLGFVVTSRRHAPAIAETLDALQPKELAADDAHNLADAREYARQWMQTRPGLDRVRKRMLADAFAEASAGSFLYLSVFRSLSEEGWEGVRDPKQFPRGMAGLYFTYFKRQFPDGAEYNRIQRPLLRVVAASTRPVPRGVLQRVLGVGEEQLQETLLTLGSLFRVTGDTVTTFHATLREWLSDSQKSGAYFVSAAEARLRLIEILWEELLAQQQRPEELSGYLVGELPDQLLAAGPQAHTRLLPDAHAWESVRGTPAHLANIAKRAGRNSEAIAWRRFVLACDERLDDGRQSALADNLNALGLLLGESGNWAEARVLFSRAVERDLQLRGENHDSTAESIFNVGLALVEQREDLAAQPHFERALAINRALHSTPAEATSRYLRHVGLSLARRDPAAALPWYEQALELSLAVNGEDHANSFASLNDLAYVLKALGDAGRARPLFERALSIARRMDQRVYIVAALDNLAWAEFLTGDLVAATEHFTEALKLRRALLGDDNVDTAALMLEYAAVLLVRREFVAAEPLFEQALAVYRKAYGDADEQTVTAIGQLANCLMVQGKYPEARALTEELLHLTVQLHGQQSVRTARALIQMALLMYQAGGPQSDFVPLLQQALQICQPLLRGDVEIDSEEAFGSVLNLLMITGAREQARELLRQRLLNLRTRLGAQHPYVALYEKMLADFEGKVPHDPIAGPLVE